MKQVWNQQETDYLVANYELKRTPELLSVLTNKTNDQLRWKAKEFGLKKKVTRSKSDISFLEDFNSPESLYWWGFLTADGCITPKQIIFSLEEKDKDYVIKFAEKCKTNVKYVTRTNPWHKTPYTMARTVANDVFTIGRLIEQLNIKPQKTYNPFDLSIFLPEARLKYFMAGLIDGDGHISEDGNIRIKVHSNWNENFNKIVNSMNAIYLMKTKSYITSGGWAILSISKKDSIKLYSLVKDATPIMPRKWNRILALV